LKEMTNSRNLLISRKILQSGIELKVGRKKFFLPYPPSMWKDFPDEYKYSLADSLTYFLTMHLALTDDCKVTYDFPCPITEPFFFKGMLYSLSDNFLAKNNRKSMGEILKLYYNKIYEIEFRGRPRYPRFKNINLNNRNRSIIPFSFGKDSLLTFGLSRELGIEPSLFFFQEPKSVFENRHKHKLAKQFKKEFDVEVKEYDVSVGALREEGTEHEWGWGMSLTQYTMLLIPYLFSMKARYLFWANEQSCNDVFFDKEGYLLSPVYEQTFQWLLTSNDIARLLGSNAIISSLIEPIHEIAVIKILHSRYPEIAKYQMSCFSEDLEKSARNKRWCGACTKCARVFILFKALGIDPEKVDFKENMLVSGKRHLFGIFAGSDIKKDSGWDQSDVAREEQLFAFYQAYKRDVRGPLLEEFKKKYFREIEKKEKLLRKKYFGVHSQNTLTNVLKEPLLKIYEEELLPLRK